MAGAKIAAALGVKPSQVAAGADRNALLAAAAGKRAEGATSTAAKVETHRAAPRHDGPTADEHRKLYQGGAMRSEHVSAGTRAAARELAEGQRRGSTLGRGELRKLVERVEAGRKADTAAALGKMRGTLASTPPAIAQRQHVTLGTPKAAVEPAVALAAYKANFRSGTTGRDTGLEHYRGALDRLREASDDGERHTALAELRSIRDRRSSAQNRSGAQGDLFGGFRPGGATMSTATPIQRALKQPLSPEHAEALGKAARGHTIGIAREAAQKHLDTAKAHRGDAASHAYRAKSEEQTAGHWLHPTGSTKKKADREGYAKDALDRAAPYRTMEAASLAKAREAMGKAKDEVRHIRTVKQAMVAARTPGGSAALAKPRQAAPMPAAAPAASKILPPVAREPAKASEKMPWKRAATRKAVSEARAAVMKQRAAPPEEQWKQGGAVKLATAKAKLAIEHERLGV